MIACIHTWQDALHKFIVRVHKQKFAWGSMDCCLFACDAVREMTAVDLAHDFRVNGVRGKYDSLTSAVRAMREFVGDQNADIHTLVEIVAENIAAKHSIDEVDLMKAQRGDVVLFDSPMGKALGIVGLRGTHVHTTGSDGLIEVPLRKCLRAWRIPKFAPVPPEATIGK
jgi:hypothetical protein